MSLTNRIPREPLDTDETEEPLEQSAKRAQAVLESHRQQRLQVVQQELEALLRKHNAALESRQTLVNGMPSPAQIVIVLL